MTNDQRTIRNLNAKIRKQEQALAAAEKERERLQDQKDAMDNLAHARDQDAREARAEARRSAAERDAAEKRAAEAEARWREAQETMRNIGEVLDGIEGALGIERMVQNPGKPQVPPPPSGVWVPQEAPKFWHSPSNNGSVVARLGCVLTQLLRSPR